MKIAKSFLCVGLVSGLLVGCGANNDRDVADKDNVSPVRYDRKDTNDGNNLRNVKYDNDLVEDNTNDVNILNNDNNNNDNDNNNDQKMEVADQAANRVAKLDEVRRANVIVTDNNAYVAVMLSDRSRKDLTKNIENKIAKEVRKTDKDIKNVYVSVNPDFYDRMTDYTDDIRNGKPISGLLDQFNTTIQRIFPNAR